MLTWCGRAGERSSHLTAPMTLQHTRDHPTWHGWKTGQGKQLTRDVSNSRRQQLRHLLKGLLKPHLGKKTYITPMPAAGKDAVPTAHHNTASRNATHATLEACAERGTGRQTGCHSENNNKIRETSSNITGKAMLPQEWLRCVSRKDWAKWRTKVAEWNKK